MITLIYTSAARYFKAYDGRAGGPGEASQQRRMGGERGEGRQLLKPGLGQPDGERKALSEMSVQKTQDAEKAKKRDRAIYSNRQRDDFFLQPSLSSFLKRFF